MRVRVGGLWLVVLLIVAGGELRAQEIEQEGVEDASGEEQATEAAVDEEDEVSPWWLAPFGYVRAAFEIVEDDPNFDFVGRNDGFVLHNARLGLAGGHTSWRFSWQISVDGAADLRENVNTLQADLDVRLRDAFIREDAVAWLGFQVGQFKPPFSAEEMRSTGDLRFASRAVGLEGVRVGRGLEEPGLFIDRQLGFMLSPQEPVRFGDFGIAYYFAMANGNGSNQILNDNERYAYYGRLELNWADLVRLGGSVMGNQRTVGTLPDLFEEDDFGYSVDLLVTWEGLEVFGQLTGLTTEYPTTGSPDREQLAYHAQASYRFDQLPVALGPAYRYAYYHPRAEGGMADGIDLDSLQLAYHTFGLNVWSKRYPWTTFVNITLTGEEAPRELDNNRYEVLTQVTF